MMMSSWNTNGGVEGKGTKFATTTSTDPDEEEKNQPQRRVGAGLRRNSCVGHHSLQSTLIVQSTISVTHQRRPEQIGALICSGEEWGGAGEGRRRKARTPAKKTAIWIRHSDLCRAVCGRTSKRPSAPSNKTDRFALN